MSIYPVKLSEWFTIENDEYHLFETVMCIIKASRCLACGNRLRFKKAVGHHSLPWGYGDIWCSWKCCNSNKIAKEDKRRVRRLKRKYSDLDNLVIPVLKLRELNLEDEYV